MYPDTQEVGASQDAWDAFPGANAPDKPHTTQVLSPFGRAFWFTLGAIPAVGWWAIPTLASIVYRDKAKRQAADDAASKGLKLSFVVLVGLFFVGFILVKAVLASHPSAPAYQVQLGNNGLTLVPTTAPANDLGQPRVQSQPPATRNIAVGLDSRGYPVWNNLKAGPVIPTPIDAYNCNDLAAAEAQGFGIPAGYVGAYSLTINGQSYPLKSKQLYKWPASGQVQMTLLFSEFGRDPGDGSQPPVSGWGIWQVSGHTARWGDLRNSTCSLVEIVPRAT